MGMMGNKGGAAIRLKFHDTAICIVAAHLAAHRDNVAGRNADFANILQRVQFVHEPPTEAEREELGEIAKLIEVEETASYGNDVNPQGQRIFRIMDHDLVIFFGDFNYRIVEGLVDVLYLNLRSGLFDLGTLLILKILGMSTEEVFEKVDNKDFAWLRANDQVLSCTSHFISPLWTIGV